jgi:hypothetical protein
MPASATVPAALEPGAFRLAIAKLHYKMGKASDDLRDARVGETQTAHLEWETYQAAVQGADDAVKVAECEHEAAKLLAESLRQMGTVASASAAAAALGVASKNLAEARGKQQRLKEKSSAMQADLKQRMADRAKVAQAKYRDSVKNSLAQMAAMYYDKAMTEAAEISRSKAEKRKAEPEKRKAEPEKRKAESEPPQQQLTESEKRVKRRRAQYDNGQRVLSLLSLHEYKTVQPSNPAKTDANLAKWGRGEIKCPTSHNGVTLKSIGLKTMPRVGFAKGTLDKLPVSAVYAMGHGGMIAVKFVYSGGRMHVDEYRVFSDKGFGEMEKYLDTGEAEEQLLGHTAVEHMMKVSAVFKALWWHTDNPEIGGPLTEIKLASVAPALAPKRLSAMEAAAAAAAEQ